MRPSDPKEVLQAEQPEQPAHNFLQEGFLLGEGCGEPVLADPLAAPRHLFALFLAFPAARCNSTPKPGLWCIVMAGAGAEFDKRPSAAVLA
jgi:hypothetical protein